jgi:hypothetical protein
MRPSEMSNHSVTIELPEHIFQRLSLLAETTARPLAEIVAQSVVSNLPPEIDKSSPEIQPELLRMQSLHDTDLLEIAQAVVTPEQQNYHEELLAKNALDQLSNDERAELTRLRLEVDRQMFCKAYAWSILRWRGYRTSSLREIPG